MAKGALFVGWGALIPGREQAAQGVLNDAVAYCMRLQQEGTLDSFDAVALEPYGGNLIGFVLIKGDRDKLALLRVSDEFVRTLVRVQLVHENVSVIGAYSGTEMQALFQMWNEETETLTS